MGGVGQVNAGGWDRPRLLVVLACVVAAAMLLLLGGRGRGRAGPLRWP